MSRTQLPCSLLREVESRCLQAGSLVLLKKADSGNPKEVPPLFRLQCQDPGLTLENKGLDRKCLGATSASP